MPQSFGFNVDVSPTEIDEFTGDLVSISGWSGVGKTTCLHNLGRDGKRVRYVDIGGNGESLLDLRQDGRGADWSKNWSMVRAYDLRSWWEAFFSQRDKFDILITDEGSALQDVYIAQIYGYDPNEAATIFQTYSNPTGQEGRANFGKVRRPSNAFEWTAVANGMWSITGTARALAAKRFGGKTVIFLFQLAKPFVPEGTFVPLGQSLPPVLDLAAFLKEKMPRRFALNLILEQLPDGRRFFVTNRPPLAYHRFTRIAKEGETIQVADGNAGWTTRPCQPGELVSKLGYYEPPDLQAVLEKIKGIGPQATGG